MIKTFYKQAEIVVILYNSLVLAIIEISLAHNTLSLREHWKSVDSSKTRTNMCIMYNNELHENLETLNTWVEHMCW